LGLNDFGTKYAKILPGLLHFFYEIGKIFITRRKKPSPDVAGMSPRAGVKYGATGCGEGLHNQE
jgi:hypothetical protein